MYGNEINGRERKDVLLIVSKREREREREEREILIARQNREGGGGGVLFQPDD